MLYCAGLYALALFLGLIEGHAAIAPEMWHIVVTTVVALFSVPTAIVLTVLRSASATKSDPSSDSLHALLGEKVLGLLEKITDRLTSK